MKKKAAVIAVCNQKGGVAKTTTVANLGIGLANEGKRVLLVDNDPQASLTIALGWQEPDLLPVTLPDLLRRVVEDVPFREGDGILRHREGVDLIPSDISLAGMELNLVNTMSRETVLRQYLKNVETDYDYILIDGMPSLGILTINMLSAADSVLIPVQTQYLSAKGLEQLLMTVRRVRSNINPRLKIDGILLTMVDSRTNYAKEVSGLIREAYGQDIRIYKTAIPRSIKAAEISAEGKSIFAHDPKGKVAEAYRELTKEVLHDAVLKRRRIREQSI